MITFDRVDWNIVFSALQMIKVTFTNIQSNFKTNMTPICPFTLMRGGSQECPISMLLYINASEVLANFTDKD